MRFDLNFWIDEFRRLGYPVTISDLDANYLCEQGVLPRKMMSTRPKLLYRDDYVEVVVIDQCESLSRSVCSRVAREWKRRRMIRPLLVFSDGVDSYVIIVPGPGVGGEAKILWLHGELYRTDREVLDSMRFRGDQERLKEAYDKEFLPYEKVRDEFFEGYRSIFEKIRNSVKKVLKEDEAQAYAQRFLGRLMFLYFLQRKGWLKGDRHFIDRVSDYRELNRLFYESLNNPRGENGIPFLNGSLFERESYMTAEVEEKLYPLMNPLFLEAREFFNRYNFTVDETAPMEVEVSVDPLLLGTVLENMLPEHERGSKGTFYTPVNEIGFMCRRALAAWLRLEDKVEPNQMGELQFVDGLSAYLDDLRSRKSEREVREFIAKLLSVKVLDPAVGSGGFLIVMMQTILQLIREAEEIVGWRGDVEQYKKRIIPNLYGFDIEPEAVEIARLRIWLSLIMDQKEPEPLPNLDMNIITIGDSLQLPSVQQSMDYFSDEAFKTLVDEIDSLRSKYLDEHDPVEKNRIRRRLEELRLEVARRTRMATDSFPIEFYMPSLADIIVMNPPYIRQENIPKDKKEKYVSSYEELDTKSDIYAYFMVRALSLLKDGGSAAIITSDKWLEVGYGIILQERLKPHLLAVYGQRRRSFQADINTVITVLRKETQSDESPVHFVYLESYRDNKVRNYKQIRRKDLRPGKWYYLRAPRIFEELLRPRLTHRLKDFAEIKRGFTTGANEFFYMKDVTHLYETDYLANPKKFKEWGVTAKNAEELQKQGLIYIENGVEDNSGRKLRFVIDKADTKPLIKSPKEIISYKLQAPSTLCLYTSNPGKYTRKYISWGEKFRHRIEGVTYRGFHEHPTCKGRRPWYKLPELRPSRILLPMFLRNRLFFALSNEPVMCDAALYPVYPKKITYEKLFLYMNSTIFLLTMELYGMKMGGGGAPLQLKVNFYEELPVPDLARLEIDFDHTRLLMRRPLDYNEEVQQRDRYELDRAVLKAMGIEEKELDYLVNELHKAFVEVVEDRLIKGRGLLAEESEIEVVEG